MALGVNGFTGGINGIKDGFFGLIVGFNGIRMAFVFGVRCFILFGLGGIVWRNSIAREERRAGVGVCGVCRCLWAGF